MAFNTLSLVFSGVSVVAIGIYMYLSISKYRNKVLLENRDYAVQVVLPSVILLIFIGISYMFTLYESVDEVKMNSIIMFTSCSGFMIAIMACFLACLRLRYKSDD